MEATTLVLVEVAINWYSQPSFSTLFCEPAPSLRHLLHVHRLPAVDGALALWALDELGVGLVVVAVLVLEDANINVGLCIQSFLTHD